MVKQNPVHVLLCLVLSATCVTTTSTQCKNKVCLTMFPPGPFSGPTTTTFTAEIDMYRDVQDVSLTLCGNDYPGTIEYRYPSGTRVIASIGVNITEDCNGSDVICHFAHIYDGIMYHADLTFLHLITFVAKRSMSPRISFTLTPAGPFSESTVTEITTSIEGFQDVSNVHLRVCGETYSGMDESHSGNHVTVNVRINITENCNGSHVVCDFSHIYRGERVDASSTHMDPILFLGPSTLSETMERRSRPGRSASGSRSQFRNSNLVRHSRRAHASRHRSRSRRQQ